jgi:hypothetical protein
MVETAAAETATETEAASGSGESERERSTILFPYNDIDSAVRVAGGVHQFGTSCDMAQLAAQLSMTATGGGFRQMLLTSKTFGVVTYSKDTVRLTLLGQRIVDPKQEKAAKAEAFLCVPLYRALYEKFKTGTVPPTAGLENEMANLGVAKKQTDKARQTFQRSAQQAGFFWSGADRLVMPHVGNAPSLVTPPQDPHRDPEGGKKNGDDNGSGGGRHPFIAGLLKEMPKEGEVWPTADRVKWLKAAAMIIDLIYKNEDTGKLAKIEVSVDSAK